MDDNEDDARYPPNGYGPNQGYVLTNRHDLPVQNALYPRNADDKYNEVDYDEDDDNEEVGVQRIGKDEFYEEEDDGDDLQKHQKKRKLKSLLSRYEFAPRVPAPSTAVVAAPPKPTFGGGRNQFADWSEHETFILLDAWGNRFLRHGRRSLRSEEWQEVAEKVSRESEIERTDTQCRNRLDTLKKRYKKEKIKLSSEWVYFKKMDMLLTSTPQQAGLSCGIDSGEYIFMSPKVYLNSANGLDEMRDSPASSEDDSDEDLPPKGTKNGADDGASFKILADSIRSFSEIYEKIENSKRQQLLELEKTRMDFHRELEMKKQQILERAQAKITKIRRGDDEENDVSTENVSG